MTAKTLLCCDAARRPDVCMLRRRSSSHESIVYECSSYASIVYDVHPKTYARVQHVDAMPVTHQQSCRVLAKFDGSVGATPTDQR